MPDNLTPLVQTNNHSTPYDKIIRLPHFHAPNRPYLSRAKRAAQFMPFKSLDVYEEQIEQKFQQLHNQKLEPTIDYDCEQIYGNQQDYEQQEYSEY